MHVPPNIKCQLWVIK